MRLKSLLQFKVAIIRFNSLGKSDYESKISNDTYA